MLKTETMKVGELEFTCTQFVASRATPLLAKLAAIISPVLGSGAFDGISLGQEADLSTLGPALMGILGGLNPNEVMSFLLELLAGTSCLIPDATGGRQVPLMSKENIDTVFSSRLATMFKVAGFAIKVNYADFFGGSAPAAPTPPTPSVK